eukprot:scaffold674347_cov50-Prasinocladus_malaysianus.AAC.1
MAGQGYYAMPTYSSEFPSLGGGPQPGQPPSSGHMMGPPGMPPMMHPMHMPPGGPGWPGMMPPGMPPQHQMQMHMPPPHMAGQHGH